MRQIPTTGRRASRSRNQGRTEPTAVAVGLARSVTRVKSGLGERPGGRAAGNQLHDHRDRDFDFIICHVQVRTREAVERENCRRRAAGASSPLRA